MKRKVLVKTKQFTTAKISINFYRPFATFQKSTQTQNFKAKKKINQTKKMKVIYFANYGIRQKNII